MQPWKTISKKIIFEQSPWLVVEHHAVELPNGRIISDWPWVITPDYVNVVACTDEGAFLCFRQTKYAVVGPTLAIVGGYLQSGEDPLVAAQRELCEETGHTAVRWIELGHYRVDANRGMAVGHLYLACQARRTAEPSVDDLEEQELIYLSQAEMEQALTQGDFQVMAWATAVALALRYLSTAARSFYK